MNVQYGSSQQKIGIFFYRVIDAKNFRTEGIAHDVDYVSVPIKGYTVEHCIKIFNSSNIEEKEEFEALYFDGQIYKLEVGVTLNEE